MYSHLFELSVQRASFSMVCRLGQSDCKLPRSFVSAFHYGTPYRGYVPNGGLSAPYETPIDPSNRVQSLNFGTDTTITLKNYSSIAFSTRPFCAILRATDACGCSPPHSRRHASGTLSSISFAIWITLKRAAFGKLWQDSSHTSSIRSRWAQESEFRSLESGGLKPSVG